MAETALLIKMRPKIEELRDEHTFEEHEVKNILYAFARDLGCDWGEERLRDFIETAFVD